MILRSRVACHRAAPSRVVHSPGRRASTLSSGSTFRNLLSALTAPGVDVSSLDFLTDALTAQDPWGRIQFLKTSVNQFQVLQQYKSAVRVEAHLVPFWTVSYLCDHRLNLRHLVTGMTYASTCGRYVSFGGCGIAAVSPSHWCSGLVLTENLFSFGSLEDLGRPAQTTVDCCATLARFPGCDGEIWDQDAISPFAFSYPKLNKAEGKRLSQLLTTEDPEHEEIHDMKAEPIVYAIPTYRIIYKVDLPDNSVGIVDSATGFGVDKGIRCFLQSEPGKLSRRFIFDQPMSPLSWFEPHFQDGERTGGTIIMQARPLSKNVDFAEMMLGAMRRSKVDWDDPNIFPASGSPEKSVDALVAYHRERLTNEPTGKPPAFFTVRAVTPIRSAQGHLIRPAPQSVQRPPKSTSQTDFEKKKSGDVKSSQASASIPPQQPVEPPRATASESKAQAGDSARAGSSQPTAGHSQSTQSTPTSRPQTNAKTPGTGQALPSKPSRQTIMERREMIQRAKLAATKQRIKAFGEKPKVLPTPALTAPHDRQGWYRKLNVTPTGACLDPAQSVMITNHIKAQFYNLSQQLHPDRTRGVSDGAGQRSLNDAWAHLQTVEARIKYNKQR